MKIVMEEGPQTLRTKEGDIHPGRPHDVSDALGKRLLANTVYKFKEIDGPKKKGPEKKKEVTENGTN